MNDVEPRPPSEKRRRWLKRLGFVGVVLFIFSFFAIRELLHDEAREIQRELDRTEPGWRIDDIWAEYQRTVPVGKQNSFPVVRRAFATMPRSFNDWLTRSESYPYQVYQALDIRTVEVPPEELAMVPERLEELREAFDILQELRHHKGLGAPATVLAFDAIGTLLPHIDEIRVVCEALKLEASWAGRNHKPERAAEATILALVVCRSLGNEPFVISQIFRAQRAANISRILEHILAQNELRDQWLAELQSLLTEEAAVPRLLISARSDRAMIDQLFENFRTGNDTVTAFAARYGLAIPVGRRAIQPLVEPALCRRDHGLFLKRANEYVRIAEQPEQKRLELEKQLVKLPKMNSIVGLLLTALNPVPDPVETDLTLTARLRCATVALACERFRIKTNRWPANLDELPKELLPSLPNDPFTGQPLLFRRLDDGVVVYSVGIDGDDGGNLGTELRPTRGRDIGFRLWDREKR